MKTNEKTEQSIGFTKYLLKRAVIFAVLANSTLVAQNTSSYDANTVPITGNDCAAFGTDVLISNTGVENTGIGISALKFNTNGSHNTAVGALALNLNNGTANTANGTRALTANTSGDENTASGYQALQLNQTGYRNTAGGVYALLQNDADDNTAFGHNCLFNNTSGTWNTGLGTSADVSVGTWTNATAIGAGAIVNASDKVRLGDVNVTVIEGNPTAYTSDGRFKSNINEADVKGIAFIKLLRPVVYNFETKKFQEFLTKDMSEERRKIHLNKNFDISTAIRRSGFIAQEVEKAAEQVGYNFDAVYKPVNENDNYALAYSQFVVPLVKAVQEQQQMIDALQLTIKELEQKLDIAVGIAENQAMVDGFVMEQNQPNPFTRETIIKYGLPDYITKAHLAIYDLSGKQVTTLPVDLKKDFISVSAENLSPGIYIYSIVADNKILGTKRMIISEK